MTISSGSIKFFTVFLSLIFFQSYRSVGKAASGETIFDQDIHIIKSDNSGLTFRYDVPSFSINPYPIAGKDFSLVAIPRTAPNGREGEVEIPLRIVPFALPPGAVTRIEVLASAYEETAFKKIAPYFVRSDADSYNSAYLSPQADNPLLPRSTPFLVGVDRIRGLNVARLAIPTARYSLNPPGLSILKSITVRVDFESGNQKLAIGFGNPGPVYGRILRKIIANYDVGQNWFMPRENFPAPSAITQTPFDSASTWVRIELSSEGIYGFGWSQFNIVGINPLEIDPSRIRVFYAGGRELPVPNNQPRPQLFEIPVKILGGDDGRFDNGDLVMFFADGVDSWQYSAQFQRFQRYRNHYTDRNVYWLTFDGNFSSPPRRLISFNGAPGGVVDVSVDTYRAVFHKEQEKDFWAPSDEIFDFFEWYWGKDRSFATSVQLNDIVAGVEANVVVRHQSGTPSLSVNGNAPIPPQTYQTYTTYHTRDLSEGANGLELDSPSDFTLDYIDVEYPRWLKVIDGNLLFIQPDTFGIIRYNLTQVQAPYVLLDISDRNNPVEITGGNLSGSNLVFDDTVSSASHKRYYISSRNRFKSPGAVSLYQMDNLRDASLPQNRADEIIITYDSFYDQAQRLAEHRQRVNGLVVRVVKVSDIYDQFSYGLFDAVAIRDFLKYAYQNWPEPVPAFALLFGDGNYDYRNNLGVNARNYIPPFENTTRMTDDHFIYFGPEGFFDSDSNHVLDMVTGRVNARSPQEADAFVNKTIDYDSNPELGPWRNRVVVVADDNLHPSSRGYDVSETFHTSQAETLSNRHIPGKFEPIKIYLIEYLMGPGGEKTAARDALISAFNQGALIVNWIGHGSANLWADEHVFRRVQDIQRLANGKKVPLVFTASCSIGMFDVPTVECMAEEFLRTRSNGAISVISATRAVFAQQNADLNNEVYDQILNSDSVGIGEALYLAKFLRANGGSIDYNDRLYMVFGDPAQVLQFPKYDVRLVSAPDSLMALSVDSLSGEIITNDGEVQSDFNGTVWVTVKDGSGRTQVTLRDWLNTPLPPPNIMTFLSPGSTIFIGPAEVRNGRFISRFFIPKDISYGSRGAKIYAYANNNSYDALGVKDSILVSGSLPSIQDSLGPTVNLLAEGRQFTPGITLVSSSFALGAEISDEHGINITGQLGHGIMVSVDNGEAYEADVTGYFRYNQGDYQSGRLDINLPPIPLGEHDISVKVWDNFNNSTMVTRRIEAISTDNLQLLEVMNYPNPIKSGVTSTAFQYCLNEDVNRVTIKIFTEAGKKIRTFDLTSVDLTRMDCNQFSWDLLDADGDRLANGIYLYKISAEKIKSDGGKDKADKTGKLVILR